MKLHIEEAFGKKITSGYLWCLHCEQAYPVSKVKEVTQGGETFQLCPYCDAGTVTDGRDWAEIKKIHKDYPETPEENTEYPLYK